MSNEKIKPHITANHSLSAKLVWMSSSRTRVRLKGSCFKQDKVTFTPKSVLNLFIVCEIGVRSQDLNTAFTLKDFFFGAVKLTKNANPDKYSYSEYGVGCDHLLFFQF